MLLKAVVLCACVALTLGALSIYPLQPKPEKFINIEGCYIEELDTVIATGSSAPSKKDCFEYRCGTDSVRRASCGAIDDSLMKNCYLFEDKKKPYPGCCPEMKCNEHA